MAWHPLGWRAAWLAEIDPFACAVLAHHYPEVPNIGDMTTLPALIASGEVEAPDLLCGGTPCQAFSVAGLRRSLDDARGNLSLVFCEIANAIDTARAARGEQPAIVFWENVPGVLNTKDNAFGCFLAGLAGEDDALVPPGGKWADAGAVFGPARAVAWRVLDAQFFGLAQRRRRVFVVASARDGFDPATVLFEWEGVRRDSAPRREQGKVAPTIPSRSLGGGGLGADFDLDGGLIARAVSLRGREGGATAELGDDIQNCLRASGGGGDKPHVLLHADPIARCDTTGEAKRQDLESCNFVAHSLRGEGFDASEDGTGRGTPLAFSCKDYGADVGEIAPTLRSMGHDKSHANSGGQVAIAFNARQDPDHWHDRTGPLDTDGSTQAVAFAQNSRDEVRLEGGDGQRCGALSTGGGKPGQGVPMVAVQASQSGVRLNETVGTLDANYGSRRHNGVMSNMQVRRLTPRECERLQGFPDDYTLIPYRNKPAADGPRYKALGNSWAVPVVRWIGQRIAAHLLEGLA